MPLGPPKPPGIKLPSSPLEPLRDIIRMGRERVEKAGSDIRSLADELRSGLPSVTSDTQRSQIVPREQFSESPLPAAMPQPSEESPPARIATACVACAVGHFSTSSGELKEALRFKGEGMTSHEVLDRIAGALEEQNALEREDLTQEKIQNLPQWERPIAEEALTQSRQLRHRLETIQSIDELEQLAADTRTYYLKLSRQWYRGRFSNLGTKKAETIAQRVGEK
jgi:hypothetical protein